MITPTRERLLDAAAELFYTQGIAGTGVDAVVRAAGVTKPTLYAQFGGKAELVAAVLRRRHEQRAAQLEAWLEPMSARERPVGVFDWLAEWYAEHGERGCGFLNAAAELVGPDEPGLAAVREEKAWLLDLLTRLCDEAGHSPAATRGSQLLLLVDGVAGRVLVGGPETAVRAVADARAVATVLLDGGRA